LIVQAIVPVAPPPTAAVQVLPAPYAIGFGEQETASVGVASVTVSLTGADVVAFTFASAVTAAVIT
jgi:hypothetical protein